MIVPASGSLEFDRHGHTRRKSRGKDSEEKTQPESVADSEKDRIRHHPGQQPQGPMLSPQQIVSQDKSPPSTSRANAADAELRDGMVVHDLSGSAATTIYR